MLAVNSWSTSRTDTESESDTETENESLTENESEADSKGTSETDTDTIIDNGNDGAEITRVSYVFCYRYEC